MATTRTVHAEQAGPAHIRASLASLDLTVIAEPGRTRAELTVSTADDSGPSAEAVNAASLSANGATLDVRMARGSGGGGTTIIQSGRGGGVSIVQTAGSVYGTMTGVTIVNGQVISAGQGTTVIAGGSPITVTARVPVGSSVSADSISGDIETSGQLGEVHVATTSGDVDLDTANVVQVRTTSGDITVGTLTGTADVSSTSGDVSIRGGAGAQARVRTVSGDIRGAGGVDLDGSSVSGRVRNR